MLLAAQRPLRGLGCLLLPAQGLRGGPCFYLLKGCMKDLPVCFCLHKDCPDDLAACFGLCMNYVEDLDSYFCLSTC